jgi:hypothetical protein
MVLKYGRGQTDERNRDINYGKIRVIAVRGSTAPVSR